MDILKSNDFIFSPKYRVLRHVVYWSMHIILWGAFWTVMNHHNIWRNIFHMMIWTPLFILYSYPLLYWIFPKYLLKGRYIQFAFIILLWAIAGIFINALFRAYIFIPTQEFLRMDNIYKDVLNASSYLCMATTTAEALILTIFKYLYKKQQEWMQTEKEKVRAELQLLKAQVHPHFLFNTLNNIYSFSLKNSPKTPGLILKLSSLLSYMLYDCKAAEVSLEKELEIMKNYVDLEKERYGNEIEISLSIDGDVKGKYIAPLLLLPFLENAFKHGTSEQLENPWLSVDVNVKENALSCKILNSKNEFVKVSENGIGIENVKKRLAFLYPGIHELNITDEKDFFVVSLSLELMKNNVTYPTPSVVYLPVAEKVLS